MPVYHYTDGDDVIHATAEFGFSWSDQIYGDGGNDTVHLGDGVTFVSGPGNDTLLGSGKSQFAVWSGSQAARVNLKEGWAEDGFGGLDQLSGINTVHLSGLGGEVTGSAADETVFALGGNSVLNMGGGTDTVLMWEQKSSDYTIRQFNNVITITGLQRTVVLSDVESIQFSDITIKPIYVDSETLLQTKNLSSFTETEISEGWWYAGVYYPPQLISYFPQAVLAIDISQDGDMDAIIPLSRGYRTGVDTRYHFQVFENVGGRLTYSAELTSQTPFIAGSRRTDKLFLERTQTELLITAAHDTAIETETRFDIPWRYGDISMTNTSPFKDITSELVSTTNTLAASNSGRVTALDAHSLAVGDINGDGMDDVLVGDFSGVFALIQTNSGPFEYLSTPLMKSLNQWTDPALNGATPGLLIDMGMGDLNGDNLDDLVVGWGHATVLSRVFFNDKVAGFTSANSIGLPASVYGADNSLHLKTWIEDFDDDGDNDLLILQSRYEPYYGGNYLQLLINDGSGNLKDETSTRLGDPATSPNAYGDRLQWTDFWQLLDINRDGALDILGSDPSTGASLYYLNDGAGKFSLHEIASGGGSSNLIWADFDGDGRVESISFASSWADSAGTSSLNFFNLNEISSGPEAYRAYDLSGNAGAVAKTLGAVFGPAAIKNPQYVGIGLSLLDSGTTYDELLALALDVALTTTRSNEALVELLYTNIVGVAPDSVTIHSLANMMNSGEMTQLGFARLAADIDVNVTNIDLIGLAQTGLDYSI